MDKLLVLYDNFCPMCTRFARLVHRLDWLSKIELKPLRDVKYEHLPIDLDINLAYKQMASFVNGWNYGYNSIYMIFARLPLLWAFYPVFYFLKITGVGQTFYIELAIKRQIIPLHCNDASCKI